MSTQLKVSITLGLNDKKKVASVMKALIPDNHTFPRGLSMKMSAEGTSLLLFFSSSGNMDTLISTIDEVLEHISVMKNILG